MHEEGQGKVALVWTMAARRGESVDPSCRWSVRHPGNSRLDPLDASDQRIDLRMAQGPISTFLLVRIQDRLRQITQTGLLVHRNFHLFHARVSFPFPRMPAFMRLADQQTWGSGIWLHRYGETDTVTHVDPSATGQCITIVSSPLAGPCIVITLRRGANLIIFGFFFSSLRRSVAA